MTRPVLCRYASFSVYCSSHLVVVSAYKQSRKGNIFMFFDPFFDVGVMFV